MALFVVNMNIRSYDSPTSSPPTPPSPLPVSFAPGLHRYSFSLSSSPSPPFSPEPSSHASSENLPLLQENKLDQKPAVFPLDTEDRQDLDFKASNCLRDLLEWFIERCCNCCAKFKFPQLFQMPERELPERWAT